MVHSIWTQVMKVAWLLSEICFECIAFAFSRQGTVIEATIVLMLTSKLERMHLVCGSAKVMLTLNFRKKFLITYYIVTCMLLITANSFSLNSLSAIHLHFNSLKQRIEPGCGLLPLEIMLLLAGCYLKFVLTPAAETACLSCLPSA